MTIRRRLKTAFDSHAGTSWLGSTVTPLFSGWTACQTATARRHDRLRAGELVIERLETRDTGTGEKIKVPDGKIHHWIATVVISGATLERTLETIQDYDRWDELYETDVQRSRLLHRDGSRFKVYFQLFLRTVVTVVLNTEYDIEYVHLGDHCAYARTVSTRIVEVEHPDTEQEREKPEGQDRGFLWRMRNYCLFQERAGDMYVQCESVSLSRGTPTACVLSRSRSAVVL